MARRRCDDRDEFTDKRLIGRMLKMRGQGCTCWISRQRWRYRVPPRYRRDASKILKLMSDGSGDNDAVAVVLSPAKCLRAQSGQSSRLNVGKFPRQKANVTIKCGAICSGAMKMNRLIHAGLAFIVISPGVFAAERPTRFWNLTRQTISEFYLAPANTTNWGDNQCKNDKDGTVESDERLRITGAPSGLYDAKLKDVSGRVCLVRDIKLQEGEIFSIEEKDLTSCDR
jgi:hypothetical protein